MVATRNHPKDFDPPSTSPPPEPSPTKRTTRSSTAAPPSPTTTSSSSNSNSLTTTAATRAAASTTAWTHTPSNLTLIWLAISLPLVLWDTGYVLGRPYTMPGGKFHAPLYTPYELYGRVDHVYGWPAWEARNGWTAAQGAINLVETAAYLVYLFLVYAYGAPAPVQGRGAPKKDKLPERPAGLAKLAESRVLTGRVAAAAVLIAYSTALVTFAKTVLYWLNEAFSGFHSIGHNTTRDLIFLWIIPNGAWLVFPAYMLYVFSAEILAGLETAVQPLDSAGNKKRR